MSTPDSFDSPDGRSAPETAPVATEPAKSRIAVEPAEVAGDTVTEASISVERIGEPDPELADQMLLVTPNEMRAVYERLRLYYEQGIWSFGMVKR